MCLKTFVGVLSALAALALGACNTGNAPASLPTSIDGWSCENYAQSPDEGIQRLQQKLNDNPATNIGRANNFDESKMAEQLRLSITALCKKNGKNYYPSSAALAEVARIAGGTQPPLTSSDNGTSSGSPSSGNTNGGNSSGTTPNSSGTSGQGGNAYDYPVCDPNYPHPPCHQGDRNGPLMTGANNPQSPDQSGNSQQSPDTGGGNGQPSGGGGNNSGQSPGGGSNGP